MADPNLAEGRRLRKAIHPGQRGDHKQDPSRVSPDINRLGEFEADVRFGGANNLFTFCVRRSSSASASAGSHSDSGTFTAAGQGPNNSSERSPAACHHSCALALALNRESAGSSLHGHVSTFQRDGLKTKL